MKSLIVLFLALFVAGCAGTDYALYAEAQSKVATAKYNAEEAKYKAMSIIATTGNDTARVAAVMAMAMGAQQSVNSPTMQAPQASTALQWAGVLVPGLTQVAGMRYNYLSNQVQSNNAARIAESTNDTFASIAGQIQAPVANVTTTSTSTVNETLSGVGTLGSGAYSSTDSHDVDSPIVQIVPVLTQSQTLSMP